MEDGSEPGIDHINVGGDPDKMRDPGLFPHFL